MKGHIRMTSDIAHMIPQAMPNIPPVEYISEGPLVGNAEYLNTSVCLDLNNLIAPTGLFIGKIRTGKSTSAKAILTRLHVLQGTNVLIFDPHGEYSDLTRWLGGTVVDMQENTLNPCKLASNLSNKQKAMQLTDILNTVFQLSEVQFPTLVDYITNGYDTYGDGFTFEILVKTIREDFSKKSRDTVTLGAILRRIELLSGNIFGNENSIPLEQITSGIVCIDVSRLENNYLRNITMLSILQYIYNTMLSNQGREEYNPDGPTRLIIMIDEAGRIASDPSSVAVKLVKESGKFKIGLFFGIQDLPDIDSKILSNYGFVFVHKLDNHDYISRIQHDCNFTPEQAARIRTLPVGTAFLKLNFKDASVQSPFIVRVLQEKIQSVQKSEFLNYQGRSVSNIRDSDKQDNIRKDVDSSSKEKTGKQLELQLVQSIAENPTFNVTQHYKNIGTDSYYGNLAKKSLESDGHIKGTYLKGKGKLLYITEKGILELGLKKNAGRFGGPVHINVIENVANKFIEFGCLVEKEKRIKKKWYTDLVVNSEIAVEVDIRELREDNIRKNLDAGFQWIIEICYQKSQLDNFKKNLDKIGLLEEEKKKIIIIDYNSFCNIKNLKELFRSRT